MVRLFILLLTLSLSTFFLFVSSEVKVGFLLSDVVLSLDTFVWMLCEHLVIVGLALVVYLQEQRYKKAVVVFLGLQLIDTFGWLLAYDDILKDLPFTFNELKIVIFFVAIVNEKYPLWKTNEKK